MIVNSMFLTIGEAVALEIVASVESGSTVTATNGSLRVSGTSVNGTCTLAVPEAGTWTVTATKGGNTASTTVEVVDTSTAALSFVSYVLNDNSWSTIRSVSDAGQGANYWSIGDRKAVPLSGTVQALTFNGTYYAFILGFNHNPGTEGPNRIHFQFGKTALTGGTDICFTDSYYNNTDGGFRMNKSATNSGGWNSSDMRTNLCGTSLSNYSGTFIAVLPAALRAVLKSVTKYTDNTGNSSAASAVTATTDYIFLLSEYEVLGTISNGNSNEATHQAQYDYYKAGNSKIKYRHGSTSSAAYWWLRSAYSSYYTGFVCLGSNGRSNNDDADYSYGFAPCFCV